MHQKNMYLTYSSTFAATSSAFSSITRNHHFKRLFLTLLKTFLHWGLKSKTFVCNYFWGYAVQTTLFQFLTTYFQVQIFLTHRQIKEYGNKITKVYSHFTTLENIKFPSFGNSNHIQKSAQWIKDSVFVIPNLLRVNNIGVSEYYKRKTNTFSMPTNIKFPCQDYDIIYKKSTHLTIRKKFLNFVPAHFWGALAKTNFFHLFQFLMNFVVFTYLTTNMNNRN